MVVVWVGIRQLGVYYFVVGYGIGFYVQGVGEFKGVGMGNGCIFFFYCFYSVGQVYLQEIVQGLIVWIIYFFFLGFSFCVYLEEVLYGILEVVFFVFDDVYFQFVVFFLGLQLCIGQIGKVSVQCFLDVGFIL